MMNRFPLQWLRRKNPAVLLYTHRRQPCNGARHSRIFSPLRVKRRLARYDRLIPLMPTKNKKPEKQVLLSVYANDTGMTGRLPNWFRDTFPALPQILTIEP
ncbi:hypothetical protein [Paraburkholderia eburnea]|uniref:hypothetical protein n=1 Tax=Paraburkholderia eburnea TaxID=1189126 RepID=UPI0011B0CBB6|nr:hypothetical protein [Paraburkholderia eburnea]